MRAELGRASPFSSVVAANGHGISDEFRVERRSGTEGVIPYGRRVQAAGRAVSEVVAERAPVPLLLLARGFVTSMGYGLILLS
jgi:hypothetical protein